MLEYRYSTELRKAIRGLAKALLVLGVVITTAEFAIGYDWIWPYALVFSVCLMAVTNIMFPASFPSHPLLDYIDPYMPLSKHQRWVLPGLILLFGLRLKGAGLLVPQVWMFFAPGFAPDSGVHIILALIEVAATGILPGYWLFPISDRDAMDHATMKHRAKVALLTVQLTEDTAKYHRAKLQAGRFVLVKLAQRASRGELRAEEIPVLMGLLGTQPKALPGPAAEEQQRGQDILNRLLAENDD